MMKYLTEIFGGPVPQTEPLPGREERMAANSAGGYVFPVDDWTRLKRFLILGCEGGSYYVGERTLAIENAGAVKRAIRADGPRVVETIVEISRAGRAPKNDPALFALAMAASFGDETTRAAALAALPVVARTGTHLFHFAAFVDGMRGWGRGLRRAVAGWYLAKPVEELAYQVTKYAQRDGFSHRDLLRLAHPKAGDARDALFRWVVKGDFGEKRPADLAEGDLRIVDAVERIRAAGSASEAADLVRTYGLTREMVPTAWLDSAEVWEALLERMPLGAVVRNLATLTRAGVLAPLSDATARVVARLVNAWAIEKARLHPVAILGALLTYRAGRGARGRHTWKPVPQVVDALNDAFYLSFGSAPRTGRRFYLAVDVSGSMDCGTVAGVPGLTPRVAAAAMSVARVEPNCYVAGFAHGGGSGFFDSRMVELGIGRSDSLEAVCRKTGELPFGGTDSALPMIDAREQRIPVDVFVVLTDSETWAGRIHPVEALAEYRERMGIAAKLIVVGMVSNGFSIADPDDAGMLDVVGFDTAAPQVIAGFAAQPA